MMKTKGSPIEYIGARTYVIGPSDHENDVLNLTADEGTQILEIFLK